jgi:uncharacterized protein (DUF2336 family)
MAAVQDLIDELETAISVSTVGRRAETLRRVTDLFLHCPAAYSEEQVGVFDDVMGLLCAEIETAARASLASVPNAPRGVIRRLAVDDAIEVAGPVLSKSPRLDDATLLAAAQTKSQQHLLAITKRDMIAEAVTNVLLDRGNQTVALSTVQNPGAQLSEQGCLRLVERSRTEHQLAIGVWARRDMPRNHLVKLFAEASEVVRARLEASDPERTDMIRTTVAEVARAMQSQARTHDSDYQRARADVESLHAAGQLDPSRVHEFARQGKFDETAIALSLLCQLPVDIVERAMVQTRGELVLVFAKAIGLDWSTTRAILLLREGGNGLGHDEMQVAMAGFAKLKPETARKAIQFYRLRAQAYEGYEPRLVPAVDAAAVLAQLQGH